jgi:hypothetical protein
MPQAAPSKPSVIHDPPQAHAVERGGDAHRLAVAMRNAAVVGPVKMKAVMLNKVMVNVPIGDASTG